jgi:hypothetical protein
VTPSPDGKKEQYIATPMHRRAVRICVVPFEWIANFVACLALREQAREGVGSLYIADESLYVVNKETEKTKRYSVDWVGTWSPDSRWIACSGHKQADERAPLCLVDTQQKTETTVANPSAPKNWVIQDISWSDDSQTVFFRQEYSVYAYGLLGSQLVTVAQGQTGAVVNTKQLKKITEKNP